MAFLDTLNPSSTPSGVTLQSSGSSSQWVVDSGTTAHFCKDRSLLMNFTEIPPVTVKMGSTTTTANAKGLVVLWVSKDGVTFDQRVTLGDVLYVPDFSVNLMSVRKLARRGYGFAVMGNDAHLTMADQTPFAKVNGSDRDELYVLEARSSKSCPATQQQTVAGSYHTAETSAGGDGTVGKSTVSIDGTVGKSTVSIDDAFGQDLTRTRDVSSWLLWHNRLNHLGVRQMVQMKTGDMVEGAQPLPSAVSSPESDGHFSCESCIIGKSRRANMPRKSTAQRTTHCLQLVHSDVCGPVRVPSLNDEYRYVMTLIDDFSRYVVIYLMRTRDEVLRHFKTYKAWAETATGQRIATVRTDGGGEYTSCVFSAYLREAGIQRQITPPYTPEHNGVAERMNLTIFGAVRSMLHRARLPATFWAEAAMNAVHIRNRCPTRAVKGKTPYEVWTGRKPSIDSFRVFGCLAYVHVDNAAKRTGKLEGRGIPLCIPWLLH